MKTIVVILLLGIALAKDAPIFADSFKIAFDETDIINNTKYTISGQMFYDAANNRERIDRTNGRYENFCSSILPNTTTSCTHTVVNGKRYIIFPQKRVCCFCCDSAHGCGILKRDWLKGAQYLGQEVLVDTVYDKWEQDGVETNYWWATTDQKQIMRRLASSKRLVMDFLPHTYVEKKFEDSVFALPDYCNTTCPSSSLCGGFQLRAQ